MGTRAWQLCKQHLGELALTPHPMPSHQSLISFRATAVLRRRHHRLHPSDVGIVCFNARHVQQDSDVLQLVHVGLLPDHIGCACRKRKQRCLNLIGTQAQTQPCKHNWWIPRNAIWCSNLLKSQYVKLGSNREYAVGFRPH